MIYLIPMDGNFWVFYTSPKSNHSRIDTCSYFLSLMLYQVQPERGHFSKLFSRQINRLALYPKVHPSNIVITKKKGFYSKNLTKERTSCHKLWFNNPHIYPIQCRYFKLWIRLDQIIKFEISKVFTVRF